MLATSLSLKLPFRLCDDLDFDLESDLDRDLDLDFFPVTVFVMRGFPSFDRERDLLTFFAGSDEALLAFNFLFRFFVGVSLGAGRAAARLENEELRERGLCEQMTNQKINLF